MGRPVFQFQRATTVRFGSLPPHSIAFGGYVPHPAEDQATRRYSFALPEAVRETPELVGGTALEQLLAALEDGLDPTDLTVYVHLITPESVFAGYLLLDPARASHPAVRGLVSGISRREVGEPWDSLGSAFYAEVLSPMLKTFTDGSFLRWDFGVLYAQCLARVSEFVQRVETLYTGLLEGSSMTVVE